MPPPPPQKKKPTDKRENFMHWKYPAPTPASFISDLRYWERFLYLAESTYKTFSIFPRNPEFFGGDEQNAGDLVMGMPKRGDA